MYYDGSISQRLRELQRETEIAYARVNYMHNALAVATEKIKQLETQLAECRRPSDLDEKPAPASKTSKNKVSSKQVSGEV